MAVHMLLVAIKLLTILNKTFTLYTHRAAHENLSWNLSASMNY